MANNVVTPSPIIIREHLELWNTLENYTLQEKSLNHLFIELCPKNDTIESILLKVSCLNDFYSTNIFDTYSVARHILKMNIDSRLDGSDYSLVNELAKVSIKTREINFYSFASKYCSHHKPDTFPIYDSFVEKMLIHYHKTDKFDNFKKGDLKNYEKFIEIIKKFQNTYGLSGFSLREIDIFLWLAGKKYFPKKYGKKS